jgi:PKD repeat protein
MPTIRILSQRRAELVHGRHPKTTAIRSIRNGMIFFTGLLLVGCGSGGGALSGSVGSAELTLQAGQDLSASGTVGTTYQPSSVTYELANTGTANLDWQVSASVGWVTVTPPAGALEPQGTATVQVALNSNTAALGVGQHTGDLLFRNLNNGDGNATRTVSLTITSPASTPMTTAARTSGVAPLAVAFDATGSGSGVVQPQGSLPDFSSFGYEWNYGDPASGRWAHNDKDKNTGTGWIGAHVFESPGTYRVTLRVTNLTGTVTDYHQDITVTDPATVFAGRTYYVAANGADGNPGTEAQPFQTLPRGITAAFAANQPTRVLFRRGDTFTTTTAHSSGTGSAAILLGAYGSGAKPQLRMGNNNGGLSLNNWSDVRLVDLHLVASSLNMLSYARGVTLGTRTTLLRCTIEGFGYAMEASYVNDATAAECELLNSIEYGLYAFSSDLNLGNHVAVLGCRFDQANYHLTRAYLNRSLFQANLYQRGGYTAMALVGRAVPQPPSQLNCILDNVYTTETIDVVAMGPANAQFEEYARDYLFEGNRFTNRNESGNCLHIRGSRVTIRNNVFDLAGRQAVDVSQWGGSPVPIPSDVRVEHNTVYRGTGSPLRFLSASSSNPTLARNNLLFCAAGSVQAPSGTVTATQNLTGNPLFADAPAGDFRLRTGSPAIDTAVPTTVRTDFLRQRRLATATSDVGAFEAGS